MWNITYEDIERVKAELQGRRAAIEARYASEIEALDTDACEIETLERVAAAFAMKHRPEEVAPPEAEAEAEQEPPAETAADTVSDAPAAVVEPPSPGPEPRSSSRWRLRLGESPGERA